MPSDPASSPSSVDGADDSATPSPPRERAPCTITRPELLVNGSDNQFRRLVHGLFAFSARHDAVRAGHASVIGLTVSQYTVLITAAHLSDGGASIRVRDIADDLWVTPTFVTMELKKLEKAGLVSKKRSKSDRRAQEITVTERGIKLLGRLAPVQQQVNNVQFGDLTVTEFETLLNLVQRMIASSDRALAIQQFLTFGQQVPNQETGRPGIAPSLTTA